ncbi:hypothetical protein PVAND_006687 [Polypedilum vanderplanki]|uniref:Uncharacterized protein n=1 Tax=Polypedilum vanderplanki TaxID=319348 RepID=A0A9J6C4Y6_POLVA|nr:hypothetical protein PVAND_006687 [Polypedilum vanderplanki]
MWSGTVCTPTDTTEKQVTIKKTKFVNDPKLANLGDVTINIKEHNACKCLCRKTASDCNSLQKFVKNQCRCECLNKKEEGECAQNPKKLFDTNSCACICRETKECNTGLRYDQETCSCQPSTETNTESEPEMDEFLLHFGEHDVQNEPYEPTVDIKYETEVALQ